MLVAGLLAERGFAITQTAVGATILAAGVVFAEQTHLAIVTEPLLYTGGLAAVGLIRLVGGGSAPRRGGMTRRGQRA